MGWGSDAWDSVKRHAKKTVKSVKKHTVDNDRFKRIALGGITLGGSEIARGLGKAMEPPSYDMAQGGFDFDPAGSRSEAAKRMVRRPVKHQAGSGQIEYMGEFEE